MDCGSNSDVVVIGHGPSTIGRKLGKVIDSMVVVRMKNCGSLLEQHAADYGTRTDYHCATVETFKTARHARTSPKQYWGYPKYGTWTSAAVSHMKKHSNTDVIVPVEVTEYWNDIFRSLDAGHNNISCGMAAVVIALDRLKPTTLWLAGFDNVLDPSLPYETLVGRRGAACGHDWHTEHELLRIIADHYMTEIKKL